MSEFKEFKATRMNWAGRGAESLATWAKKHMAAIEALVGVGDPFLDESTKDMLANRTVVGAGGELIRMRRAQGANRVEAFVPGLAEEAVRKIEEFQRAKYFVAINVMDATGGFVGLYVGAGPEYRSWMFITGVDPMSRFPERWRTPSFPIGDYLTSRQFGEYVEVVPNQYSRHTASPVSKGEYEFTDQYSWNFGAIPLSQDPFFIPNGPFGPVQPGDAYFGFIDSDPLVWIWRGCAYSATTSTHFLFNYEFFGGTKVVIPEGVPGDVQKLACRGLFLQDVAGYPVTRQTYGGFSGTVNQRTTTVHSVATLFGQSEELGRITILRESYGFWPPGADSRVTLSGLLSFNGYGLIIEDQELMGLFINYAWVRSQVSRYGPGETFPDTLPPNRFSPSAYPMDFQVRLRFMGQDWTLESQTVDSYSPGGDLLSHSSQFPPKRYLVGKDNLFLYNYGVRNGSTWQKFVVGVVLNGRVTPIVFDQAISQPRQMPQASHPALGTVYLDTNNVRLLARG